MILVTQYIMGGLLGNGEGGEFAEGFGFGFVEEVGVDLCRAYVGVAHELLDSVDGDFFCQQQYAEGVAGAVEETGFFILAFLHHRFNTTLTF